MLTEGLGMLVGLVLALTGAGGGVLSVPLLVFGLHLPVSTAGPVGLMAIALSSGIGAALGLRDGLVRFRAAAVMAAFGSLAAPAGLWLALHTRNRPLALMFAAVLVIASLRLMHQARRERTDRTGGLAVQPGPALKRCRMHENRRRLVWTLACARAMAATGLASGFLSGLLGVGGGFVIVPALRVISDLPMASIVGTSLAVITLISGAGVVTSVVMHDMPWRIALPFALGATVGLLLGRRLAGRLSGPHLQMIFAGVCLIVAGLMVVQVH